MSDYMDDLGEFAPEVNNLEAPATTTFDAGPSLYTPSSVVDVVNMFFPSGVPSYMENSNVYQSLLEGAKAETPASLNTGAKTDKDDDGGLLGKVTKFIDKNKALTEIVSRGISSAATDASKERQASAASRSRIDELNEANRLKQEDNQRISASVSGLRVPTVDRELAKNGLRRADGTKIYNNGRLA